MALKTITGMMVVNWKTGSIRVMKRGKRTPFGTYELPIHITVNIEEPKLTKNEITANIVIPEVKFKGAFMENFVNDAE